MLFKGLGIVERLKNTVLGCISTVIVLLALILILDATRYYVQWRQIIM